MSLVPFPLKSSGMGAGMTLVVVVTLALVTCPTLYSRTVLFPEFAMNRFPLASVASAAGKLMPFDSVATSAPEASNSSTVFIE